MPRWSPSVRQQLLRHGSQRRWWRLHSRLWHWELPSALHRQRRHQWPGCCGDKWFWLANCRAVCASESTKLDWLDKSTVGSLRLWQRRLSARTGQHHGSVLQEQCFVEVQVVPALNLWVLYLSLFFNLSFKLILRKARKGRYDFWSDYMLSTSVAIYM